MFCATEKVVLHQRIWIMLEVKADLLYKDHISSSPATSQGDIAYALLWMFLFCFFTEQHSTAQGVGIFGLPGFNGKEWVIFLQCDFLALIHHLSKLFPSSILHIIHKDMTTEVSPVLFCMKFLNDYQAWNRGVYSFVLDVILNYCYFQYINIRWMEPFWNFFARCYILICVC